MEDESSIIERLRELHYDAFQSLVLSLKRGGAVYAYIEVLQEKGFLDEKGKVRADVTTVLENRVVYISPEFVLTEDVAAKLQRLFREDYKAYVALETAITLGYGQIDKVSLEHLVPLGLANANGSIPYEVIDYFNSRKG